MEMQYCYGCMRQIDTGSVCPHCGYLEQPPQSHHLKPGTRLRDRYMIGRVIGEGGFGITYIGLDPVFERKVAIKEFYMPGYVLRDHMVSDEVKTGGGAYGEMFEKNREKFLNEARVLAKLEGEDGVVGVRDFFEENNTAYLIMDLLRGVTLREYVKRHGKLSGAQTLQLLEPVFRALENIHAHGLIHRDISPDNIMVTEHDGVKLLDFGAARQISERDIKSLSVILKPGYSPEEQYRSKGKQGPWTDLYALCATMYRCITGIVPDDAMERMFDDKLVPPAELDCDCTQKISDVLMKGLGIRQADRYQSIPELWAALNGKAEDRERTISRESLGGKTVASDPAWIKIEDAPKKADEPITGEYPAFPQEAPKAGTEPKTAERPALDAQPLERQPRKKSKLPIFLGVGVLTAVLAVVLILGNVSENPEITVNGTEISVPTTFAVLDNLGWSASDLVLAKNVEAGEYFWTRLWNDSKNPIYVHYYNPGDTVRTAEECTIYQISFSTKYLDDTHTVKACEFVLGKTAQDEIVASSGEWQKDTYVSHCGKNQTGSYRYTFDEQDILDSITILDESGID